MSCALALWMPVLRALHGDGFVQKRPSLTGAHAGLQSTAGPQVSWLYCENSWPVLAGTSIMRATQRAIRSISGFTLEPGLQAAQRRVLHGAESG